MTKIWFRFGRWTGMLIFTACPVFAHQGHHHPPQLSEKTQETNQQPKLRIINENYLKKVKPIFEKKCMDCHSSQTRFPWYHSIPGVKQAIDQDITEARRHLDFSQDYPFQSHASKIEDLEAIKNSVSNGSMPPFSYRFFHPGSKLSPTEAQTIMGWTDESLDLLGKKEN